MSQQDATLNLIRLRLALEFGVEPEGDILPPPARNQDGLPRVIASSFAGSGALFFRHDVPELTRARLRSLGPQRALTDEDAVRAILAADAPSDEIWRVRWYTIHDTPPLTAYPDVIRQDGRFVILIDGQVAAQAWTVAGNDRASEVEVETLADYRRRGYARQVVAAWAADALAQGKHVFYSHLAENVGSAGVSRSLGLIPLSTEVEYR